MLPPGRAIPPAIDPGVYRSVTAIRRLVDEAAELTVRNPNFWLRLCAMGDLGFSEAYMYGEIDCEDLVKVFLVRVLAL